MKVAVLGGGLAGIYYIYRSLINGSNDEFILIEKEKTLGGLCKSYGYKGNFYDIGGHRFFTKNKEVENIFRDIVGEDVLEITRVSKIYFRNKFLPYPININSIKSLEKSEIKCIVLENFKSLFQNPINYEEYVINNFGQTLYKLFFKDYTEKVLGLKCDEIDTEWGKSRINFDKFGIVKNLFGLKVDKEDSFLYPKIGINALINNMLSVIYKSPSVKIIRDSEIKKITVNDDKIISITVENEISVDNVISTIPVTDLAKYFGSKTKLSYRSLVLILLVLKDKFSDNHWIYFPEKEVKFGRLHEPANWSQEMAKGEGYPMCIEYFCDKGSEMWNKTSEEILNEMDFSMFGEVIYSKIIKIENAYPKLIFNYKKELNDLKDKFAQFKNLKLIGRTGAFEYINMDQVIENIDKILLDEK